jgi:hypothetical protein
VACSCKGRGFCPSCGAKRATVFAAFLREEVLERLARYIMRPPVNLARMRWEDGWEEVIQILKPRDGLPLGQERIDALQYLALKVPGTALQTCQAGVRNRDLGSRS